MLQTVPGSSTLQIEYLFAGHAVVPVTIKFISHMHADVFTDHGYFGSATKHLACVTDIETIYIECVLA